MRFKISLAVAIAAIVWFSWMFRYDFRGTQNFQVVLDRWTGKIFFNFSTQVRENFELFYPDKTSLDRTNAPLSPTSSQNMGSVAKKNETSALDRPDFSQGWEPVDLENETLDKKSNQQRRNEQPDFSGWRAIEGNTTNKRP
jgi:hypothetical protein